jgi:hypothetical protein
MNAAEHEDAVFCFDVAVGGSCELAAACPDSARLQRATQGAEQSASGRRHHVVEGGRVRLGHLTGEAVVTRNRSVRAKADRRRLDRQLREPKRALDAREQDLRSIDHVTHGRSRSIIRDLTLTRTATVEAHAETAAACVMKGFSSALGP